MQRLEFCSPEEAKAQRAEVAEVQRKSLAKKKAIHQRVENHQEASELNSKLKEVWDD